jgi:hypothetical protein
VNADHPSPHRHFGGVIDMTIPNLADDAPRGPRGCRVGRCHNHTDRPIHARGLCQSCYVKHRRSVKKQKASCHPDRPHVAKGFCKNCYSNHIKKKLPHWRRSLVWRRASLKYNFGITLEQFNELFAAQNGKCAICQKEFGKEYKNRANVDHCHATGKVRGLLCFRCNTSVGVFENFGELASKYLEKWK